MIYDKTNACQFYSHESRSVASDGLTKCIQAMVSLNVHKNSANKFGRKMGFKIENEIEDQDQSIPKLIGILTHVFCTFGPNLVILAWTGDELSCRQPQNGVTVDKLRVDAHARTHTHRQTQTTTIPEGQNWPRVKNGAHAYIQVIIIMCISLRDRDIKYVVGMIGSHMILKSRTSQHIFQHKSAR